MMLRIAIATAGLLAANQAAAAEPHNTTELPPKVREVKSVTQGQLRADGHLIDYEASAGLMVLRDSKGVARATFGYTAYVRRGDDVQRPLVFAFNGGPGSASVWLHMGLLGPRRVVVGDLRAAPFGHVNNAHSLLSVADVVLMDPVGTGYSRLLASTAASEYWGVEADADACAEFVRWYLREQGRWLSPKFILGESYGGMRAGALAYALMNEHDIDLNGVILLSPFMSYRAGVHSVGNDLPHVLSLSTFAAMAHHLGLVKTDEDRAAFLGRAEAFSGRDYLLALHAGTRLSGDERSRVLGQLEHFTGIERAVWDRANLRLTNEQFAAELRRRRSGAGGATRAPHDGLSTNLFFEAMDREERFSKVRAAYVAAFYDYLHQILRLRMDDTYRVAASLSARWDYTARSPGESYLTAAANTGLHLENAIHQNPTLQVLVLQGQFDLVTPRGATDHFIDHLHLTREERARVKIEYYDAGHMMYVHEPTLATLARDLRGFVRASSR